MCILYPPWSVVVAHHSANQTISISILGVLAYDILIIVNNSSAHIDQSVSVELSILCNVLWNVQFPPGVLVSF